MFEFVVIIILLTATAILFLPFYRDNGFRIYADEQQFIPRVATLLGSREHMLNRLADLRGDMESGKLSSEDFQASRQETVTALKEIDAQLQKLEALDRERTKADKIQSKDGLAGAEPSTAALSTKAAPPTLDAEEEAGRARFCAACGHGLKQVFRFCPNCGEKIEL